MVITLFVYMYSLFVNVKKKKKEMYKEKFYFKNEALGQGYYR